MEDGQRANVANVAVLERVFEAVGDADVAKLATLYTPDYVLELPYAPGGDAAMGGVRIEGRDEALQYLAAAFEWVRLRLTLTEVYPSADPDTVIAEYSSEGRILDGDIPYANTYIGIWQFHDGLVRRTREFYNPAAIPR